MDPSARFVPGVSDNGTWQAVIAEDGVALFESYPSELEVQPLNEASRIEAADGSLLALGIKPRLAATVLAAQLVPVTAAGHAFWEKEGAEKQGDQIQFCKNLGLIGSLLTVALDGAK